MLLLDSEALSTSAHGPALRRDRARALVGEMRKRAAGDESARRELCCKPELGSGTTVGYAYGMTQALDAVIAKLTTLPPDEQDRVARWLLDELRDEEQWTRRFRGSQDALGKLAAEARADRALGRSTELDPDKL